MESKHFWESWTFWVNAFFVTVALAQVFTEVDLSFLPDGTEAVIVGIANIILRFKTKVPVRVG